MEAEAAVADPPENGLVPEGIETPEDQAQEPADIIITGSGQLSMTVGGKRATGAALRLVGGKIEVDGEYPKGSELALSLTCRVTEVAFVDHRDPKTGDIVGCERRHKAKITGVTVVGGEGE